MTEIIDTKTGLRRFECTKETPWQKGQLGPIVHVDASEVEDSQRDGYPGGDIVTMNATLAEHRVHREWFLPHPQVLAAMEEMRG